MKINLIGNWFSTKASIRKKLVISFSILVSVSVMVLGAFSFVTSKENLENQMDAAMTSNISRLAFEIESRQENQNDSMKSIAYNISFRQTLEKIKESPIEMTRSLSTNVEPVLWSYKITNSYVKEIELLSPNIDRGIGAFLKPDMKYRETDWYKFHQTDFKTTWSFEDNQIYISRTILDTFTSSDPIGVVRVKLYPKFLGESIESLDYMNNGVVVVDAGGSVIYRKSSDNEELDNKIIGSIAKSGEDKDFSGALMYTEEIDGTDWKIYYYINENVINEQTLPIIKSTLLVVLVCFVLCFVLIGFLSQLLSKRILSLKDLAESIARGNLEHNFHTEDTDEIGVVTNSLYDMSRQLGEMIEKVYKIEVEKKTIELKALQAMINPHFLYNSLSSIKWKALYKNEEEIAEIAGLIATFYRTSLNNGKPLTTVGKELENVRAYIKIQQLMHENKFRAIYNIDEENLDCEMLNFIIQPFVENAFAHGIQHLDKGSEGKIVIEFYVENSFLVFNVMNSSGDIDGEEIRERLLKPNKGYGIANIRERIALFYNGEGSIEADVNEEGLTCFTVRLKNI